MRKILMIEDDKVIGQMLYLYFSGEGYKIQHEVTAQAGIKAFLDFKPEVILLDLMLPDYDGIDLCRDLRRLTTVPIIIVSMKTEVSDRINALTSGADDFVCKPFSMQELKARIEAVLRRFTSPIQNVVPSESVHAGHIMINYERRLLFVDGIQIETTYSEWNLINLFFSSPGRVFTRDQLINSIRGTDSFVNDRSIDVHIMNLRKKIEKDPRKPKHLKTIWGTGYKFVID